MRRTTITDEWLAWMRVSIPNLKTTLKSVGFKKVEDSGEG